MPLKIRALIQSNPVGFCLFFLGAFYILIFQSYRAYEIDNAWFLSFSRNWWVDRYAGDYFQNGVFPDGMGGTVVFGRLAAIAQGLALHATQWRPVPAMLLSTSIVLAGLAVWYCFLRRSGLCAQQSSALVLALGLTEPFVGMAERFRYEPFCFLLMASCFWLGQVRRPVLALIIGSLAVETEPAAALVFAALLLFLYRSGSRRDVLVFGSLVASGCLAALYAVLHPDILHILKQTAWHRGRNGESGLFGGFVRGYFFDRKRHIPELMLFAAAFSVYLRRRSQRPLMVSRMAEITLLCCVFSFALNWPTPAYMVFFFPPALTVAGWALCERMPSRWKSPWLLPVLVGLLMVPQYLALAWVNRNEGFRDADLAMVSAEITSTEQRVALDDESVRIMGDYSLWYAHPAHYRAISIRTLDLAPGANLFLCFDGPIRPVAMVDATVRYCSSIRARVEVSEAGSLRVRGHMLHLLIPRRDAPHRL